MPSVFAQVTLLAASGNSADNQVNGFALSSAIGTNDAGMDSWAVAIKNFYDSARLADGCRGLAQNNHLVKFYDIPGSTPNYPFYETTFNFATAPATVDMPLEVALCVSYRNTVLNSVPRARRRGRIYISGWAESANTAGRPVSTAYQGLADAYADYVLETNSIDDYEAGIWSRTDGVVYPIDEVWADNEWDTVRRRGGVATTRYTLTV